MANLSSITKFLVAPSKVAQALDWRKTSGSILSFTLGRNNIHLGVASHPSVGDSLQELPRIPLATKIQDNRKVYKAMVIQELASIINDFHICGVVVRWPVQADGWCGASCGRVLNFLDHLADQKNKKLVTARPICLWDPHHSISPEDSWGRTAIYSRPTNKTLHHASVEQYQGNESSATIVLNLWNDFCQAHWPEHTHDGQYQHQHEQYRVATSGTMTQEQAAYEWIGETEGEDSNLARAAW